MATYTKELNKLVISDVAITRKTREEIKNELLSCGYTIEQLQTQIDNTLQRTTYLNLLLTEMDKLGV